MNNYNKYHIKRNKKLKNKEIWNKIDIDNSDITYKYVNCLFKLFGSNPLLIHIFNDDILNLKNKITCKKIIFRLMDILDLKK